MISQTGRNSKRSGAFTLVELLIAVAVIAVGMVFVLGAFSQCMSSLATAQKMVTADQLLNAKIWEEDLAFKQNNGTEEGELSGVFPEPYEDFNWTQTIRPVSADWGNQTSFVQEVLNEEVLKVVWPQGRVVKDVSVIRYVKKKKQG